MTNNDSRPPEDDDQQTTTLDADSLAADEAASDQPPTPPEQQTETLPAQTQEQSPTALTTTEPESSVPRTKALMVVRDLKKTYRLGRDTYVQALRGISLDVNPGEFVAVMGPSGSGKSTFMHLIGCLDRPTSGEYWLSGRLVSSLSPDELASVRNQMIGFVFQGFNLLAHANALKNVELPMVYSGMPRGERRRRAERVLRLVGLERWMDHKPMELSGGQQQRVAIARSLVNGPVVLLADEPTGNLDSLTGLEIMGVLQALNEQGMTIVLVTHDPHVASFAKRRVEFLDGQVINDVLVEPLSARD